MTTTYSNNLNLALPGFGDDVNSWNVPVVDDYVIIDNVSGGITTVAFTNVSVSLTTAQAAYFQITCTGTLTANVELIFPETLGGRRIITNICTGAYTLKVLNGASDPSGGVVIPQQLNTPVLLTQGEAILDATGNVSGPPSSTVGHVAAFYNTAGTLIYDSGLGIPASAIVGISDTQTLTNKTLTAPTINAATLNAATLSGTMTGGTFASATLTTPTINGATVTGTMTVPTQPVGNSSTDVASTAFVCPAYSATSSGYVKLASGVILQWGQFATSSSGQTNWTFPVAFPNAFLAAFGTTNGTAANQSVIQINNASATTTYVPVGVSGTSFWVAETVNMLAIGC